MKKNPIRDITICGIMSSLLCISAMFTIPLPLTPVPVTLQTFFICVIAIVMSRRQAIVTVCIYLLMGVIGLPVFSGMRSGPGVLVGPTGGFLLGFIPAVAMISTLFKHMYENKKILPALNLSFSLIIGSLIIYAFGTAQLMGVNSLSLSGALTAAVLPFVFGDTIKIAIAVFIIIPFYGKICNMRGDFTKE